MLTFSIIHLIFGVKQDEEFKEEMNKKEGRGMALVGPFALSNLPLDNLLLPFKIE